jgi:hypothetical protein
MRGGHFLKTINYYVAPYGSDDGSGSNDEPLLTLTQAQRVVRNTIQDGMSADVTVYLYGGHYELMSTLQFDNRDSGRNGFRVSYRNVPGEEPILVGGYQITGWEKHTEGIWRTKLDKDISFQTLYADGERIPKARYPITGYFHTDKAAEGKSTESIIFHREDIPADIQLEDAQVFVWPGEGEWNWFSETKKVRDMDPHSRTIHFETPATWGIGEGSRYYIQGSLKFLQSPGQFHMDERDGVLYYWPRCNASPLDQTVMAPSLTRLIELKGQDPDNRLHSLTLTGLTLVCTDSTREYKMMIDNVEVDTHREGLVYIDNASTIELSSCTIRCSGSCGIFLDHYAQSILITNNKIERFGYVGIYASGFGAGDGNFTSAETSYTNKGHTITNNTITSGGELIGHGCGILLFQSGDNEISHNLISHMPRYGISMKGLRYGGMPESLYGISVTWDNHWDFLHSRNNRIAFNDISHVMKDSQDGGMIEAWGPGRGNVIHGNHLHHSGIHFSYGFGIYLDDACDDFTVTNNMLNDLYSTGEGKLFMLIFSKGIGNQIRNNLLVNNPLAVSAIGTQEMVGEANRHVIIENNLIYNSGYLYYFINWDEERFKIADRNLYWKNGESCRVAGEIPPLTSSGEDRQRRQEYTWEQWRNLLHGKYDAATIIADPLFFDAEAGDYRLQQHSPAFKLGWRDIEFDMFGPRKSY